MGLPGWVLPVTLGAMFIGLVGVFVPIVPGIGLIWLAALAYAVAEKFASIDPITFAVLTVLTAIGVTTDLWTSQVGARIGGASIRSTLIGMAAGAVGALIGAIFFGVGAIPGAIIGALAGVTIAEWRQGKDWREAVKAAGGWLVGCTLSGVVQFAIAVLMIAVFVWQALKG